MFKVLTLFVVFGAVLCGSTDDWPAGFGGKIKYVIALMLENRSFDHMMGFLRSERTDIDGCLPTDANCTCPLDPTVANSTRIPVGPNATYIQPGDPDHSCGGTRFEIFGTNTESDCFYPGPMDGFVKQYAHDDHEHPNGTFIMECFTPDRVPIITTLANEFAVNDRWFADVPANTEPNRIYSYLATSAGMANNDDERLILGFTEMSIFKLLDEEAKKSENGLTWEVYMEDVSTTIFVEYCREHPEKFHFIEDFYENVKNGDLKAFSWIDPRYADAIGFPATDQHPDHDVRHGEQYMKDIYEALRASPVWNQTLLIIFYDEHGGFYDHVPPPNTVNPDGKVDESQDFNFTRLGVRVPAVFVSPWIKKGTTFDRPNPMTPNQYSHSSLMHTLREQFMPHYADTPITERDRVSIPFDNVINLSEMRTDCPMKLPDVPTMSEESLDRINPLLVGIDDNGNKFLDWIPGLQPISAFLRTLMISQGSLCGVTMEEIDAKFMGNQDIASQFLRNCTNQWLGKTQ